MNVVVVGAGKMGLPLACELAVNGAHVTAVDVNSVLVDQINQGIAPFVEPLLQEKLTKALSLGKLKAETNLADSVPNSDVIIIIVPVLVNEQNIADLSIIQSVTATIGQLITPNTLVIYETTLPVGTTRKLLEQIGYISGKVFGRDVFGAFSPERVKSLHVFENLSKVPKIVGGMSELGGKKAEDFYRQYLKTEVINLGSLEAAEMAKLADMVYRDVNIALANELARYAETVGIDFYAVRNAANTSGEAYLLLPGIGVGGHCTPVYPHFMINHGEEMGVPQRLAEQARLINDGQADHAMNTLKNYLGSLAGKTVLILGLGFRPELKEATASPAFLLRDAFEREGCKIQLHDPFFTHEEIKTFGFEPLEKIEDSRNCTIILNTAHKMYKTLDWKQLASNRLKYVMDGRNVLPKDQIEAAGILYFCIGKPHPKQHA